MARKTFLRGKQYDDRQRHIDQAPDCRRCDGAGVIQTGTSKLRGATFSTCPACGGSGAK